LRRHIILVFLLMKNNSLTNKSAMQDLKTGTKVPILFLIFNRFDTTKLVFEKIKKYQPKELFIASDGPRTYRKEEKEIVQEIRNWVLTSIDWPCDVKTLFRENNLGCGRAVSGGINWFFEKVEMGIILEDDCLPSLDFFRFCSELLLKYKDDYRIGHICGCNFQDNIKSGEADYYFSRLTHVWGWASWRRVWENYNFNLKQIETFIEKDSLKDVINYMKIRTHIYKTLERIKCGEIDTWDYQYFFSNRLFNYTSIIPNNNMIINIGFNSQGTHTFYSDHPLENLNYGLLNSVIEHPNNFLVDYNADNYTLKKEYKVSFKQNFFSLINNVFKQFLSKFSI
jgi:hypothetical protein